MASPGERAWRGPLILVLLGLLTAELLARFAFTEEPFVAFRRLPVGLVLAATLVAALRGPIPAALMAGAVGGAYAVYFLYTFGTSPTPADRIMFGAVVGTFIFATTALVSHGRSQAERAAAEALEHERRRAQDVEAANRELGLANETLRDFTYVVAHDLRNPVRGIRVILDDLAQDAGPRLDPAQRRDLSLGRAEATRLAGLLESLLEYGRASRFDVEDAEAVDVAELLATEGCRARFEALARERDARIVPPAPGSPRVVANPGGLALVLGNLVTNAVKHNPKPSPLVRVETRLPASEPGIVEIAVEDDGPGFPAEAMRRFQDALAGRENPKAVGRSGFGLVLVARAVDRMGGSLRVDRSPEGGASMRVRLPAS